MAFYDFRMSTENMILLIYGLVKFSPFKFVIKKKLILSLPPF